MLRKVICIGTIAVLFISLSLYLLKSTTVECACYPQDPLMDSDVYKTHLQTTIFNITHYY